MAKKRAQKMPAATPAPKSTKAIPVRLDLSPKDYERLERQASKRGLTKASTARMVILEWINAQEGGPK